MVVKKKFVGQLKTGDRVQISQMHMGNKVLFNYDISGIEYSDDESEFDYATISLVGVGFDYIGVQTWYMQETIRVVED